MKVLSRNARQGLTDWWVTLTSAGVIFWINRKGGKWRKRNTIAYYIPSVETSSDWTIDKPKKLIEYIFMSDELIK